MKRIHHLYLKGINWICVSLLTVLGFTCEQEDKYPAPEYGNPWQSYTIKDRVIDKEITESQFITDTSEKYSQEIRRKESFEG